MQKGEMIEYKGFSLLKLDGRFYAQIENEEIPFWSADEAAAEQRADRGEFGRA